MPILFYDRPAIQAEAMTFFFACQLSIPNQTGYISEDTILQQGMHLNVFSKVYYDRVYFSCAKRNMTCRVRF